MTANCYRGILVRDCHAHSFPFPSRNQKKSFLMNQSKDIEIRMIEDNLKPTIFHRKPILCEVFFMRLETNGVWEGGAEEESAGQE